MSDMSSQDFENDRTYIQWAVFLTAVAIFMMVGFQSFMLLRAGENLNRARIAMEKPAEDGKKIMERVESLAGRVAQLAEGGNANAKQIVDTLARQGVKLSPPAPK